MANFIIQWVRCFLWTRNYRRSIEYSATDRLYGYISEIDCFDFDFELSKDDWKTGSLLTPIHLEDTYGELEEDLDEFTDVENFQREMVEIKEWRKWNSSVFDLVDSSRKSAFANFANGSVIGHMKTALFRAEYRVFDPPTNNYDCLLSCVANASEVCQEYLRGVSGKPAGKMAEDYHIRRIADALDVRFVIFYCDERKTHIRIIGNGSQKTIMLLNLFSHFIGFE
jgi:hypothetical protein